MGDRSQSIATSWDGFDSSTATESWTPGAI
jgi:hypothetical protein